MPRKCLLFGIVCLVTLGIAGCGDEAQLNRLRLQENRWHAKGVHSYSITVRHSSVWHSQTSRLVVRDDRVVQSTVTCVIALVEFGDCGKGNLPAEHYTVQALFDMASTVSEYQRPKWLKATFDPTYGIPLLITYDDPESIDEEWTIEIVEFLPLK